MNGELYFNQGFHSEVAMARARRLSLFHVIGPGGSVVEASSLISKARDYLNNQRYPHIFEIHEIKDNGSVKCLKSVRPVSNFLLADLVSVPIRVVKGKFAR